MAPGPRRLTDGHGETAERREAALAALRPWAQRAATFSGWDFAELQTRTIGPAPPWSYAGEVAKLGASAGSALDLGTGGGERLAEMRLFLPAHLIATEQWHRNVPIARNQLGPFGVPVVAADSLRLPFADASFDLVLSRHEAIEPREVARVLSPGGVFITQQVGRHSWQELDAHFPRRTKWPDHRTTYSQEFQAAGMRVESREHESRVAYPSLGAFVFMLLIAPWEIEALDIESDLEALLALERECAGPLGFVVTECRYLLIARK